MLSCLQVVPHFTHPLPTISCCRPAAYLLQLDSGPVLDTDGGHIRVGPTAAAAAGMVILWVAQLHYNGVLALRHL